VPAHTWAGAWSQNRSEVTTPTIALVSVSVRARAGAGEMGALRIGRVDPAGTWVEVAESVEEVHGRLVYGAPKTYSRRRVSVPTSLAEEIREHLTARPTDPDAFVFTAPDGGPLRHSNFYRRHYKQRWPDPTSTPEPGSTISATPLPP